MHEKVFISVATKKSIHAEVAKWLIAQDENCIIDIVNSPYPLEHVRNLQVNRFLESGAGFLLLVDSDCVPQPRTVELLKTLNLPFVSAPHPSIINDETGILVMDKTKDGYVQHRPFDSGLQKCDAVGCAGMMIRKDVFSKIPKPYFKFVYNSEGQLIQGEDFYFCDKLKVAGIEVYAYCDLTQTHYVEVAI